MIFYGTKATTLATEPVLGVKCPNCGKSTTLVATVFGRYAHIYWIPLFPFSKVAVLSCEGCLQAWEEKHLPEAAASAVREVKANAPHRRWEWAGLGLLLMLGGFITVAGIRGNREDDALLASPRAGDIYTVRSDSSKRYTLLKVQSVRADSVELLENQYSTDSSTPLTTLKDKKDDYDPGSFTVSRASLLDMRRQGRLTDVSRDGKE